MCQVKHNSKLYIISKCIEVYEESSTSIKQSLLIVIKFYILDGSPVNPAICEEISKFCEGFTMVVYEKIF